MQRANKIHKQSCVYSVQIMKTLLKYLRLNHANKRTGKSQKKLTILKILTVKSLKIL